MRFQAPGHFRSAADFAAHLKTVDPDWAIDQDVPAGGALAQPITVHGRELGNRFACHPMEGWDGTEDGRASDLTLRRWRNFGRSGAALVWGGEAFAVQRDGRANHRQLYLDPNVDAAKTMTDLLVELRAGAAEAGMSPGEQFVGLQLTHSGRFSRPEGPPAPLNGHRHPLLGIKYPHTADAHVLTDGELEAIGDNYVRAANLAQAAGFDFVDVKTCHGYLLHELLGARGRNGTYGGDFAGRTRLFERIVAGIRSGVSGTAHRRAAVAGGRAAVRKGPRRCGWRRGEAWPASCPTRMGSASTSRSRPGLTSPSRCSCCRATGSFGIELVNVTLGSPYYNPHLQRPAAYPPSDGYQPPADPLQFVKVHLDAVRTAKQHAPDLKFVGTGYTYLQEWLANVAQHEVRRGHTDFIGWAACCSATRTFRAMSSPAAPMQRKRICRTFSDCTTGPRNGMISGCFPLDPFYKAMPEAKQVKALRDGSK